MNKYAIYVGVDTRYGDRVSEVVADGPESAQQMADEAAAEISPNMIGWAKYIGAAE